MKKLFRKTPKLPEHPKSLSPPLQYILPPRHPDDDGKLTVVLDMDETLLHSEHIPSIDATRFDMVIIDDENVNIFGIHLRPMVEDFILYGAEHFELVVFTAASRTYARPVLDALDPRGRIKHRLYRDSCMEVDGFLVKPIRKLGRRLARTVLVDNNEVCMLTCPDNGLLVPSYYGGRRDECMKHLADILQHLHTLDDVRPFLKEKFSVLGRLRARSLTSPLPPSMDLENPDLNC